MLIIRFNSVKVLSNVLRDADDVLPQRDLSSQQKKELDEIARGCHDVLNRLKRKTGQEPRTRFQSQGFRREVAKDMEEISMGSGRD